MKDSQNAEKILIAKKDLLSLIQDLLTNQRETTRNQWHRTLPSGDYLVDRWQKAQELGFGEKTSIYDSAVVIGNVRVGRQTWIGPFTVLDGSGGLEIGDHCSISAGVQIYTHDTVNWATSAGTQPIDRASVKIGDSCYIGPNVVISKGVTIGDRCVIGANSFGNKDIPTGTRAWGSPAREKPD